MPGVYRAGPRVLFLSAVDTRAYKAALIYSPCCMFQHSPRPRLVLTVICLYMALVYRWFVPPRYRNNLSILFHPP